MFKPTTAKISACTDSETALVVPTLKGELHHCCAEEPGYAADNLPKDYGQTHVEAADSLE